MDCRKFIGQILGRRYEILELLSEGGTTHVYKARCHLLNRFVTIKILKEEFAKDDDFRKRFYADSQAVTMLSHPNIMAVYDVSRSKELEYIVMELIDGITLKQYMNKKGLLNWRDGLHVVIQIIKALSHTHNRGIIHRDIKPHNIMILRDGSVKVADFGITHFASKQHPLTKGALGSVHYISPEQARGNHIDARSDIYSVGVVLYEMLTGRLPFEGENAMSVALQHIQSLPLSPREINGEIPEALEMIILKAMAPKLTARYASAEEMLKDLEDFRKNPAISLGYDLIELKAVIDKSTAEDTRTMPGEAKGMGMKLNTRRPINTERNESSTRTITGKLWLSLMSSVILLSFNFFTWVSINFFELSENIGPYSLFSRFEDINEKLQINGGFVAIVVFLTLIIISFVFLILSFATFIRSVGRVFSYLGFATSLLAHLVFFGCTLYISYSLFGAMTIDGRMIISYTPLPFIGLIISPVAMIFFVEHTDCNTSNAYESTGMLSKKESSGTMRNNQIERASHTKKIVNAESEIKINIDLLTDQTVIGRIASDKNNPLREKAFARATSQTVINRIASDKSDPLRDKAFARATSQTVINRIASDKSDPLRDKAFARTTNQTVINRIASDKNDPLRKKAFAQVTNQTVINRIVSDKNDSLRENAFDKVVSQIVLRRIASDENDPLNEKARRRI
jgi:serine/threonine protein kinase